MALGLRVSDIEPFDATHDYTFSYVSSGSTLVARSELVISGGTETLIKQIPNATNNVLVTQQEFANKGIINGGSYVYYFIIYDSQGNSKRSSSVAFNCYSTPIITIKGLSSGTTILNVDYTFNINYTQAEDRNLDYLIIRIYESDTNTLLKTSKQLRPLNDKPNLVTYDYTFETDGVSRDYYVIITGTTVDGMRFQTNDINFTVDNGQKIGVGNVTVTNKQTMVIDGFIRLECGVSSDYTTIKNILANKGIVKLKRKRTTKTEWVTVNNNYTLLETKSAIVMIDRNVPSGEKCEYCITVMEYNNGTFTEYKTYTMPIDPTTKEKGSITTKFTHTFVSIDDSTIFRLYSGVVYSNNTRNIDRGQLMPINSQFPVVLKNGTSNYYSLNFKADIYGENYLETRKINRNMIQLQTEKIVNALVAGQNITITDWNGNIWLGVISNSPSILYNNNYGNGTTSISFEFVEQGKYDNEDDLYNMGIIKGW